MSQQLDYESTVTRTPGMDSRAIAAGLKFVGYGFLFLGGAILAGSGVVAEAIHSTSAGPPSLGQIAAVLGFGMCGLVLVLLFMGAASVRK